MRSCSSPAKPGRERPRWWPTQPERAFEEGACVLFGHSEEDVARPYQLFVEALSHYVSPCARRSASGSTGRPGVRAGRTRTLTGHEDTRAPPSKATDSDSERYLMFASVVASWPGCPKSNRWYSSLTTSNGPTPGASNCSATWSPRNSSSGSWCSPPIGTASCPTPARLVETLGALRRQHGVTRIELGGLNDDGVVSFMESASGQTLDDDGVGLAHSIYRETDGNPFFVGEVLRHLAETGAIYRDQSGRWATVESLADTLCRTGCER